MRILDIDLDYFLDNIETDAASNGLRLSREAHALVRGGCERLP